MNSSHRWQSLRHFAYLLVVGSELIGCGGEGGEPYVETQVGESSQAVMTDEPGNILVGYAGVVELRFHSGTRPNNPTCSGVGAPLCTGWMMSSRVIVTSAHCLDAAHTGSNLDNIEITYMRPGFGRDCSVLSSGDLVSATPSPFWGGDSISFGGYLLPKQSSKVRHDIAVIVANESWRGTTHEDYFRVFNDDISEGDWIDVYGMGNRFNTVSETSFNRVRAVHRQVSDTWYDNSDLYFVSENGQTERVCAGDSGAPVVRRVNDVDLVAGSHSRSTRDDDEYCGTAGTNTYHEKLTWDSSDDLSWILSETSESCQGYYPTGTKNNYFRCFPLPLISNAPSIEQKYGSRSTSVAVAMTFL